MEGHILWAMLGELGVIAGIVSLLFRRFEHRLDKREQEKAKKDEAKVQHDKLMLGMTFASLSLAEATAEAVQRIPDAHCNGEMHEALSAAKRAKKEYRDFQEEQTIEHLH